MSDETQTTPPVQAEPTPAGDTAPVEAKIEAPKPQEPDWRAAYVGLQTNLNKAHARNEGLLEQTRTLASVVDTLKQDQRELLKATGGEDAVRASQAREANALAAEAQRRAATAATKLIGNMSNLLGDALEAAGIARDDKSIDWAGDATDPDEWYARARQSVTARISKAGADAIAAAQKTVTAKSQAEIKAEADALAQRIVKESGADKIDTAKGATTSSYVDRVRNLKHGTPEYDEWMRSVLSGRTQVK